MQCGDRASHQRPPKHATGLARGNAVLPCVSDHATAERNLSLPPSPSLLNLTQTPSCIVTPHAYKYMHACCMPKADDRVHKCSIGALEYERNHDHTPVTAIGGGRGGAASISISVRVGPRS